MAVKFMLTGAASAQAAAKDEQDQENRKNGKYPMFRFWIKEGEEAKITFIDGGLTPEGYLLPQRYYEHNLKLQGKWGNTFVCPEQTLPQDGYKCPICASGDRPSLVAVFTVIDHRPYYSEKTKKTYENTRKLFVAKPQTMELLAKIAVKRGGLAGATFDVSRMGEQSASVGNVFDFIGKTPIEELKASFTHEIEVQGKKQVVTYFEPADYEEEIQFLTPEEITARTGIGSGHYGGNAAAGSGVTPPWKSKSKEKDNGAGQMSPGGGYVAPGSTNYSDQL